MNSITGLVFVVMETYLFSVIQEMKFIYYLD